MSAQSYAQLIVKKPWYVNWRCARRRCTDSNHKKYKWYGGKGIQFRLTQEECAALWERDKAAIMDRPELDRIDTNKDYELSNCRFIEKIDNLLRRLNAKPEPTVWED